MNPEDIVDTFLVVPPGFEQLAASELNEKYPGLENIRYDKGGIELSVPFSLACSFNIMLKIPSAVFLRIASFKCRDFPKLFNKVKAIKWSEYLVGGQFSLHVSSQKSRLLNEKRIEVTMKEAIERRFQMQPPKKPKTPFAFEIQVRFMEDVGQISLDLSGEPLFKRGYKVMEAVAPIRENLAAALYRALRTVDKEFTQLIDPMCGSGTLLLEAQLYNTPTSYWRNFAFQAQPLWIANEVRPELKIPTDFIGWDKSQKNIQLIENTLKQCQKSVRDKGEAGFGQWHLELRDLFKNPKLNLGSYTAVICNPPYGERLSLPRPAKEYFPSLLEALLAMGAKTVGVIIPAENVKNLNGNSGPYRLAQKLNFKNGGLSVVFCIYQR